VESFNKQEVSWEKKEKDWGCKLRTILLNKVSLNESTSWSPYKSNIYGKAQKEAKNFESSEYFSVVKEQATRDSERG
jgi:hypothetical protein